MVAADSFYSNAGVDGRRAPSSSLADALSRGTTHWHSASSTRGPSPTPSKRCGVCASLHSTQYHNHLPFQVQSSLLRYVSCALAPSLSTAVRLQSLMLLQYMQSAVREKRIFAVLCCDLLLLLLLLMGLVGCLLFWLGVCWGELVLSRRRSHTCPRRHVFAHRLGDSSGHRCTRMQLISREHFCPC